MAGELLRLCIHHPDIEIMTVHAPDKAGLPISYVHHGFIGEERLLFTSNFDATALDIAFLIQPLYNESDWMKLMADKPNLKLVLFENSINKGLGVSFSPVYGLSEINRKPLVRGARVAVMPNPIASPILVALFPLSKHLLLSGDVDIDVIAPADIIIPEGQRSAQVELMNELPKIQTSFTGRINLNCTPSASDRQMRIRLSIPTSTSLDEIFKIYNSIYDDHNFTFVINRPVSTSEVEGTNKVIVSAVKNSPDKLELDIVADPRMRGGAGEALHLLNLMFNLHEKTGLDLKTSAWNYSDVSK